MKIALAQLDFQVGNFTSNSQKIINAIQKAKKNNSQLIIFPELAVIFPTNVIFPEESNDN